MEWYFDAGVMMTVSNLRERLTRLPSCHVKDRRPTPSPTASLYTINEDENAL
ncbi:hypothetical protein BDV27DRAFT_138228 [Aspergillus caelatus]|uniref:Uncharacterized protein n=1 Tax=Aspergillus caelatus TaxID=61420 RepID=A0A5N6ZLK0_9EURO|nr:uncharacterized protein BDV27DRAFT_138228 [Aspergillus caelatus]KAE8358093.1 hypothetical protein BDV27DRAFT_138228 [Aspergillus caelatus]